MEAQTYGADFNIDDLSIDELRELVRKDPSTHLTFALIEKIERQNATIRDLFADVLRSVALQQEGHHDGCT